MQPSKSVSFDGAPLENQKFIDEYRSNAARVSQQDFGADYVDHTDETSSESEDGNPYMYQPSCHFTNKNAALSKRAPESPLKSLADLLNKTNKYKLNKPNVYLETCIEEEDANKEESRHFNGFKHSDNQGKLEINHQSVQTRSKTRLKLKTNNERLNNSSDSKHYSYSRETSYKMTRSKSWDPNNLDLVLK